MRWLRLSSVAGVLAVMTVSVSATRIHASKTMPAPSRQIIAVYLGTVGTDAQSGMIAAVRDMKVALAKQATSTGRTFVSRGVSLAPSVEGGMRHLALFGAFDEVSVGGNWTNSSVIRYLGGNIGTSPSTSIPQVILLERDIQQDLRTLQVGPEREIARFIGTDEIGKWVGRGAPLP